MKKEEIINIAWKPLFAAVMTGILSKATAIDPVVIGLALGIAAACACILDIKKIAAEQTGKEN